MPKGNVQRLRSLYRERDRHCEFCGVYVVCMSLIPIHRRIERTHGFLKYRDFSGKVHIHPLATVEHIKRKVDGGTHHRSNLALACQTCNEKRAVACNQKERMKDAIRNYLAHHPSGRTFEQIVRDLKLHAVSYRESIPSRLEVDRALSELLRVETIDLREELYYWRRVEKPKPKNLF